MDEKLQTCPAFQLYSKTIVYLTTSHGWTKYLPLQTRLLENQKEEKERGEERQRDGLRLDTSLGGRSPGLIPLGVAEGHFKKRAAEAGCVSFCTMCSSLFPCSLESRLFLATCTCISRHSDKVIHGSLVDTGTPKKIAFFSLCRTDRPFFLFWGSLSPYRLSMFSLSTPNAFHNIFPKKSLEVRVKTPTQAKKCFSVLLPYCVTLCK